MTVNGKRDQFTPEDFNQCSKAGGMKRGRAKIILNEVIEAVQNWPRFADQAGLSETVSYSIQKTHRTQLQDY
jgi:serine/threonine-protein kinase HipA